MPLSMPAAESVRALYNGKAREWQGKYSGLAPLRYRLDLFAQPLLKTQPSPAPVLELGCGTGNLAAHLASLGYQLTACDVAEQMLVQARTSFPNASDWILLPSEWTRLPFEEGRFRAVVASSVFEYLADPAVVLAECARVLTPGGELLFSVPDVDDPVRRVEGMLRPYADWARHLPLRRVRSYAVYLSLSRQRLSLETWQALARQAGLEAEVVSFVRTGHHVLLRARKAAR